MSGVRFSIGEVSHLLMVIDLDEVPDDGTRAKVIQWRARIAARRSAIEACGLPCNDDLAAKTLCPSARIVAAVQADRRFDAVGAILEGNEPLTLQRGADA